MYTGKKTLRLKPLKAATEVRREILLIYSATPTPTAGKPSEKHK